MIQRLKNLITLIKNKDNKVESNKKHIDILKGLNRNLHISIVERSLFLCALLIEKNKVDSTKINKYTYNLQTEESKIYFIVRIELENGDSIFFNLPYNIESSVNIHINLWNLLLPITDAGDIQSSDSYEKYITGNKYEYYDQIIRNYTI